MSIIYELEREVQNYEGDGSEVKTVALVLCMAILTSCAWI